MRAGANAAAAVSESPPKDGKQIMMAATTHKGLCDTKATAEMLAILSQLCMEDIAEEMQKQLRGYVMGTVCTTISQRSAYGNRTYWYGIFKKITGKCVPNGSSNPDCIIYILALALKEPIKCTAIAARARPTLLGGEAAASPAAKS